MEKIDETYFCTPLMIEPDYVNFGDYDVNIDNSNGTINYIKNKQYGKVVYMARELN
jgi:hypothetical protein